MNGTNQPAFLRNIEAAQSDSCHSNTADMATSPDMSDLPGLSPSQSPDASDPMQKGQLKKRPQRNRRPSARQQGSMLQQDSHASADTKVKAQSQKGRSRKPAQRLSPKAADVPVEDDSRRDKHLERNRQAASRCRQRKKLRELSLEEHKDELEMQHNDLQRQYTELLEEVSQMKTLIMSHASCDDNNIDGWLENEASRFVQSNSRVRKPSIPSPGLASPRESTLSSGSSPATSADTNITPPSAMEKINFDHMPDNLLYSPMDPCGVFLDNDFRPDDFGAVIKKEHTLPDTMDWPMAIDDDCNFNTVFQEILHNDI